mgnify:CR=1 FL=1
MSMPTLSNEPVNNQWLRPLLLRVGSFTTDEQAEIDLNEVEQAILSKLESIEQEAYKKGWQERGDYELRKYENDK